MLKLQDSKPLTVARMNKIRNEFEESKLMKKLNSLLSRKDVINLENEKLDAIRMLVFHLESSKEFTATDLVKFLKS